MGDPPLFSRVLPQFAAELESALTREHPDIASQVRDLRMGRVCDCPDPGCATFDVPGRRPRDYDFSLELEELNGLVLVDVAKPGRVGTARTGSRRILGVEVLYRPDLRKEVEAHVEIGRSPSVRP
ncbi:MAG: hypothetical protein ACRDL0_06705 [Thermoleophilaceae bacterium]